jgi:hypothetical protein
MIVVSFVSHVPEIHRDHAPTPQARQADSMITVSFVPYEAVALPDSEHPSLIAGPLGERRSHQRIAALDGPPRQKPLAPPNPRPGRVPFHDRRLTLASRGGSTFIFHDRRA